MSICKKIKNNLFPLLADEIDDKESSKLKEHLKECPQCNKLFLKISNFEKELKATAIPEIPADLFNKINSKLQKDKSLKTMLRDLIAKTREYIINSLKIFIPSFAVFTIVMFMTVQNQNQKNELNLYLNEVFNNTSYEQNVINNSKGGEFFIDIF